VDSTDDGFDFKERLEELEKLNAEVHELGGRIADNVRKLLEG